MTEAELVEDLMTLIGGCVNPEIDGQYVDDPAAIISELIPDRINASQFAEELLGLGAP